MAKTVKTLVSSVSLMLVALLLLAACGADPTATPTAAPTATPTPASEAEPTAAPTDTATAVPAAEPTAAPTAPPVDTPTAVPTPRPTPTPTPTPVPGFDAEGYFSGKTIRIVTEGSLGGGTWTMVQLLAQKWAPLIPGSPRIVLQHLRPPIAAMNRVWNADPDGLTLYASSTNRLPDELDPQAEFKSTGWSYVGAHQAGTSGYVVTRDSPYTRFVDAIGQLGSGGELIRVGIEEASPEQLLPGSTFNLFLLRDMLGIPLDIITVPEIGATTTALLMVERGELDMIHVSNTWAQLPQLREGWIAQGVVIPFLNVGDPDAIPDTPEGPWTAPHITEFLEGDDLQLWNGLNATELFYRKAIMGPEGVPTEVLDALRASYAELIVDPEFIELFTRATGDAPTLMTGQFLQDRSETLMGAYLDAVPQVTTLRERLWADARG